MEKIQYTGKQEGHSRHHEEIIMQHPACMPGKKENTESNKDAETFGYGMKQQKITPADEVQSNQSSSNERMTRNVRYREKFLHIRDTKKTPPATES